VINGPRSFSRRIRFGHKTETQETQSRGEVDIGVGFDRLACNTLRNALIFAHACTARNRRTGEAFACENRLSARETAKGLSRLQRGEKGVAATCDVEDGGDDKCRRSREDRPVRFGASLRESQ
jgi:hypothetical protein